MDIPDFLFEISELAKQNNQKVYLVGGAVRDLLLNKNVCDFDLLCSHNAIELARFLEKSNYLEIKSVHQSFGTAKVYLKEHQIDLDLATAREEVYEYPGSLPKVQYPCAIEDDLRRRDFSINSIALELKSAKTTELVDPFEGKSDLQSKLIRVLHNKSYLEDPTRIIRAVRFAIRFDCKIADEDIKQIALTMNDERVIEITKRIRGIRFGIELKRLLELNNWLEGVKHLSKLAAWDLIRRGLVINNQPPSYSIDSWDAKLTWILWNNSSKNDLNTLPSILNELGISLKTQKQVKKVKEIINSPNILSLSRYKEINGLANDFKNIAFSLNYSLKENFELMSEALPNIKPKDLIEKGFTGKSIAEELNKIFQSNLQKLRKKTN
ncbi:MAG: hypothetical protein QNJ31_05750 [Candidatus Caenarcaniphilales bacterium]|nr:hypothetical protein [Candidatus Caenarcaniphilales bacterium]